MALLNFPINFQVKLAPSNQGRGFQILRSQSGVLTPGKTENVQTINLKLGGSPSFDYTTKISEESNVIWYLNDALYSFEIT